MVIYELDVKGQLVIFPAYAFYVQQAGHVITQRNDKVSNRKLNEILMQANLAKVLGQNDQIPHISVYSADGWRHYYEQDLNEVVKIDAGDYGKYKYYTQLVDEPKDRTRLNVIIPYLMQYSSAKLTIR